MTVNKMCPIITGRGGNVYHCVEGCAWYQVNTERCAIVDIGLMRDASYGVLDAVCEISDFIKESKLSNGG